jgi:hypothetical protein
MTTANISSLEELNQISYQNFIDSDSMIEFNYYTSYILNNNLITQFRTALNDNSTLFTYINLLCETTGITTEQILSNQEAINTFDLHASGFTGTMYFVPFSKKDFISSYFSDLTPQLSDVIFDLMKSTGRLIQIGSGGGKAFVIKPIQFNESHFQSIPAFSTPEQLLDSAEDIISSLRLQMKNSEYYVQRIAEKDEIITNLTNQIVELNQKIHQVYQTTWR